MGSLALERLAARDRAQDEQQHDRAQERDEDALQAEAGRVVAEERARREASDELAQDADYYIAEDTYPTADHH